MTIALYLLYAGIQAGVYAYMAKSRTLTGFFTFVAFAPVITLLMIWFIFSIISSKSGVQ